MAPRHNDKHSNSLLIKCHPTNQHSSGDIHSATNTDPPIHVRTHARRVLAACCLPISSFLFYTVKHDLNFNQATISHLNPGSLFRFGRQVAKKHFFSCWHLFFWPMCARSRRGCRAEKSLKEIQSRVFFLSLISQQQPPQKKQSHKISASVD